MNLEAKSVVASKATGKTLKVIAVVKQTTRKAENKVVVADARTDSLGRAYLIKGTERILLQDSIRRRYQ